MKASGPATDFEEIDSDDDGIGWIAYPEETLRRASHALAVDGDVWLVDPVDAEGLDDLLAEHGEITGVVVLLDRHTRDSAQIANRHDVSVWVPSFMDDVVEQIDAPVEQFQSELGETGYALHRLVDNSFWQEAVLYNEETGVLVVPEAVGTTEYFKTHTERLGVHPLLRLTPPGDLNRFEVDRIRVGHGAGISENAGEALAEALDGARRRAPSLLWKNVTGMLFG
jgi:hypothetical protein